MCSEKFPGGLIFSRGGPKLRLIDEAIHNLDIWFLSLEGPKHPVPNDENSGIVLVQTVSVGPVVHLVMTGRVQDIVQGPEAAHQLSVDPELVQQVQLLVDHSVAGRDEQGQGHVEWLNTSVYRTIIVCDK